MPVAVVVRRIAILILAVTKREGSCPLCGTVTPKCECVRWAELVIEDRH